MEIAELHELFVDSSGICTDTRKIKKETLFFALKGDNFNGNEYALKALEEGCTYAIVDEDMVGTGLSNLIKVDSVLRTLQDLANYHRKQFDIPILCITGSNGKTTSKELIGAVLSKKFNLLITEGNLNNHLGVPFTLLRLNENHDFAIIETGANKPGDIKELVEIAEPNFGVVTNIGAAHIEGFGSLEGVEHTKTEMYRYLEGRGGTIFYNSDDPVLLRRLPENTKNVSYGIQSGDIKGSLKELNPFVVFKWAVNEFISNDIETQLVGKYNLLNFLLAATIGEFFGVKRPEISSALADYKPSNNRSQVTKTARNTLIIDCYNANATSMKAAIESFLEMKGEKKLAILGDMLELGAISIEEHLKIVKQIADSNLEVILVGAEFMKTDSSFPKFATTQELLFNIDFLKIENTLVLLKGSRGIKLEALIEHL